MIFNKPSGVSLCVVAMTKEEAEEVAKTLRYAQTTATGYEPEGAKTMRLGLQGWLSFWPEEKNEDDR